MSEYGYNTDMVLVIDATAKKAPLFDKVKERVLSVPSIYVEEAADYGSEISSLRVRVIAFRDFGVDEEPIVESPFFVFPEEEESFRNFVISIEAKGGQGDAACALEALALALKSDFSNETRPRHLIFLFTLGSALRLGLRKNYPSYPEGMPRDLNELNEWWEFGVPGGSLNPTGARLAAFVPRCYPWSELEIMNRYWPVYLVEERFFDFRLNMQHVCYNFIDY